MKQFRNAIPCLLLTILLLVSWYCVPGAAEGTARTGDVNGDGAIDARDALLVLQYAVGKVRQFPIDQPVTETESPPDLHIDSPISDYEFSTLEAFLAAAEKSESGIDPALAYVPDVPDRYALDQITFDTGSVAYHFSNRDLPGTETPNDYTITGVDFTFYSQNEFNAPQRAETLRDMPRISHITTIDLPNGGQALLYVEAATGGRYRRIVAETTINQHDVAINFSVINDDLQQAQLKSDTATWNEHLGNYVASPAEDDVIRLLTEMQFAPYFEA